MSGGLASSLVTVCVVGVAALWIACIPITALDLSTTPFVLSLADDDHVFTDERVCRTRFLDSDNGSVATGREGVVGIAAVLELRRPEGQGCGAVSAIELQTVAALFWAVRRLNGQTPHIGLGPYIPGVRLELQVYDDCSQDVLAARHVGQLLSSHPDFNCTPAPPPLAGILGTTTSHTTTFIASLLSGTKIPHFGTSATVSVLSNSTAYPTFFRTVPSDLTQSKVMVDLVRRLQWTYIVGIYTRDNYGIEGFQEFKRLATQGGVCVFKEKSVWHSDHDLENTMERFIREILIALDNTRFSSLGVVYFGHDTEAIILFNMIQNRRSSWHDDDQEKVNRLYWLMSDGVGTSLSVASLVGPYTLLSISPPTVHLKDTSDFFFHALDNPEELGPYWQSLVREYLQDVQGCSDQTSPVSSCKLREKIETFGYIPAALDSFYSLAALLGRAHKMTCDGGSSVGLCQNLLHTLKEGLLSLVQPGPMNYSLHFSPERLPVHFRQDRMLVLDEFGDFMPANSPLYFINVALGGQWTKIGEYSNSSLSFDRTSDLDRIPRSECGTSCEQCRRVDTLRFAYHPGDVLLLGLFSISSPAGSASFRCGDYRRQSSSVASLLAFLHSTETLAVRTGGGGGNGTGGRRFGALVLDDCYNKLTASSLLSELFSGKTMLRDPESGEAIDMKKVVAVIGSQSSGVTLSALSLLTPLHIPSISYSATSPDLDDRLAYPYFLRPVPSDVLQALAIMEVVRHLNVTYVGALHQNNNYGWRGIQTFTRLAEARGICVESPVPVNDGDSEDDLHTVLRDIRNKDAMVVVVFLVERTVVKLLDAIQGKNLDLIFLASEAWTLSADTLQNQRGATARGSMVLSVDSSKEAGGINIANHLKQLTTPELAEQGLPWMRDFWENEKQCNLPGGFTNSYRVMCAAGVKLGDEVVQELATDQKVVQTVNAVASIITALEQQCQGSSDPAGCMLGLSAERTTGLIRSVELRDEYRQTFRPYLDNGNGNVGFTLHNVQKTTTGTYTYVQVGHFDPDQGLQIQKDIVFYDLVGQPVNNLESSCQYKVQCRYVCGQRPVTTSSPPITVTPSSQRSKGEEGVVAAVVVLAVLCVVLVVLLVVVVFFLKRRGRVPCLGVAVKDDETLDPQAVGGLSGRVRMMEGQVNLGYSPTSPRASFPLPPVPRSAGELSTHQYNVVTDLDGQLSESSLTSSSHHAASPGLRDDRLHDDHSEDEGHRRRIHRRRLRSQNQDLRHQVQWSGHTQDLRDMHKFQSMSSLDTIASGRDRRRARSEPRVDRPRFLPVHGQPQQVSPGAKRKDGRRQPGRPRSNSHDPAFRTRLGALSDDDQQILLKYLQTARQQSHSPCTPPSAFPPMTASEAAGKRPTFFVQPEQSASPEAQRRKAVPQNVEFENPPSFCGSSELSLNRQPENDPSSFYLHALPAERDLYLEVLPEPSEHSPSLHTSSPSLSPITSTLGSSGTPTASSPIRAQPAAARVVSPATAHSSAMLAMSPQTPQAAISPLMSVHGSPASESSGAVFVSPDQAFPPFLCAASPHLVSPSDLFRPAGSVYPHSPQHSLAGAQGQNRTSPGTPHLSSPTHHPLLLSDPLQHSTLGNNSPTFHRSTPQTSPQGTAAFPGVYVRDRTGAIFWLPGGVASPGPGPVFPGSSVQFSPPGGLPRAAGHVNQQPPVQRSDLSQSLKIESMQQASVAMIQSCTQQTSVTPTPTCMQLTPVTLTPTYTQLTPPTCTQPTPVTLSPTSTLTPVTLTQQTPETLTQQTPVTLTQLTPVTLTPTYAQLAPPTCTQPTPVTLTPTSAQTPVTLTQLTPVTLTQQTPVTLTQQTPVTLTQQTPVTLTQKAPVTLSPTSTQPTPVSPTPAHTQQTLTIAAAKAPVQQTSPHLTPAVQVKSKTPRMGVDSLLVPRRQTAGDQNHSTEKEGLPTLTASSYDITGQSGSAHQHTPPGDDLTEHSDDAQKTQASGPISVMSGPVLPVSGPVSAVSGPDSVVSVLVSAVSPPVSVMSSPVLVVSSPSEEGGACVEREPVLSPPPCMPRASPEMSGSGGSDHTSGDSGTGEDLNHDADNVNARIEVCV